MVIIYWFLVNFIVLLTPLPGVSRNLWKGFLLLKQKYGLCSRLKAFSGA